MRKIQLIEKYLTMYSAMHLNHGHFVRALQDDPYPSELYNVINDCDTDSKSSQHQLSFDAGYVVND